MVFDARQAINLNPLIKTNTGVAQFPIALSLNCYPCQKPQVNKNTPLKTEHVMTFGTYATIQSQPGRVKFSDRFALLCIIITKQTICGGSSYKPLKYRHLGRVSLPRSVTVMGEGLLLL